jgi:hypothetical protein
VYLPECQDLLAATAGLIDSSVLDSVHVCRVPERG